MSDSSTAAAAPPRLVSLDTYRGLVMFLMLAEVWQLSRVAGHFPESGFWSFLAFHQSHVPWIGCSLHDIIQPSFTFMVGVALPFSIASRIRKGQTGAMMHVHALWRAFLLIALGIFLRSMWSTQTYFTFVDTLTQIGLGYYFLFLLGFATTRTQWGVFSAILIVYWLIFALWPLPPADFDYTIVGVPNDWEHLMSGFAAHWNKNTNFAAWFDTVFLNLFPRETPFLYSGGGYQTLNCIPTLATMILGVLAGQVVRSERSSTQKIQWLLAAGIIGIVAGLLLNATGINPLVKRIWTPSFTLYSGGWCILILAALYWIIDVKGFKSWAFPLVVIGMNSIAIYVMSWTISGFIIESLQIHLGQDVFLMFGEAYQTMLSGTAVIIVDWLILYWMYKNRVFVRI